MAALAVDIDVTGDFRQVEKALRLFPHQIREAQTKAMNTALRSTSRQSRKMAEAEYNILPEYLDKLRTRNRVKKAGTSNIKGELTISGNVGVPLRYFRSMPRRAYRDWKGRRPQDRFPKRGVRFQLKKGGRWTTGYDREAPGNQTLFWVRGKQGQIILVYRVGPKLSSKNLFGPSLIQAVTRRDIIQKLSKYALDTYSKRLMREIRKSLKESGLL